MSKVFKAQAELYIPHIHIETPFSALPDVPLKNNVAEQYLRELHSVVRRMGLLAAQLQRLDATPQQHLNQFDDLFQLAEASRAQHENVKAYIERRRERANYAVIFISDTEMVFNQLVSDLSILVCAPAKYLTMCREGNLARAGRIQLVRTVEQVLRQLSDTLDMVAHPTLH